MVGLLVFFVIFFIFLYIKNNHLHIDFKSFFKKGFKKKDESFGVYVYTGFQGSGKTYSAINFVTSQRSIRRCNVITNIKSYYKTQNGILLETYIELLKKGFKIENRVIYEADIMKIIDFVNNYVDGDNDKNILILFDEIFTVIEKATRLQKQILAFLSQMRKRKIIFVSTAQIWSEINITFRRYARFQISCNMLSFPVLKYAFLFNVVSDATQMKWSDEDQEFIAPVVQTNFSKGNKKVIELYDTYEVIGV